MPTLNLKDLAKKIALDIDPVSMHEDWSKTLERCLMTGTKFGETPLIPNGTVDDPTIVRIPELLSAVSTCAPYREGVTHQVAKHIHLVSDEGAGFHYATLGPGHDGEVARDIEAAMVKDSPVAKQLRDTYRKRSMLAPVGGYGWKWNGVIRGPKLAGMPWRSPSGPGARNCLEGQHCFNARDFGRERSNDERADGVWGWDLSDADFGWTFGDGIAPSTVKPNGPPNEGLYAAGMDLHNLGRMAVLISGLSDWHITYSTFGPAIPSSILHSETGGGVNVIGNGLLDYSTILSGGHTVHVSGETVELENLTVDRVGRVDSQHAVYIDMGPKITTGPRAGKYRGRNIRFTNNTHQKWGPSGRLGYYQLCDKVLHTKNSGPIPENMTLSATLYHHGCVNINLSGNRYVRPSGKIA